jgi:hypothetical protein
MIPEGPGGAQARKIDSTPPEDMPIIYGGRDDVGAVDSTDISGLGQLRGIDPTAPEDMSKISDGN